MSEFFVWDKIIKSFKDEKGSETTTFLFSNSKLLKVENNQITLKIEPIAEGILSDINSSSFKLLKNLADSAFNQDTLFKFVSIDDNNLNNDSNYMSNIEIIDNTNFFSYEDTNLNSSFKFENYFYSYDNRAIVDASNLIIDEILNPNNNKGSLPFNPLFLHGSSGIGKTHIVNAIGNELFEKSPNLKILYKTSTAFIADYTDLFKGSRDPKKIDIFKELYYNLDVLIIDDIQMLATREGTLNEFFSIFENLRNNNKYTIITSDVNPKLLDFPDRLMTRFLAGIVQEINIPDTDTKTQIFKYQAHNYGFDISEDAIKVFINSSNNVRELLGYINNVQVDLITNDKKNSCYSKDDAIEIVNKTTGNFAKLNKNDIFQIVCEYYDITIEELIKKSKVPKFVKARNFCAYFLRDKLKLTNLEIAKNLGMKDHSNIVKLLKKFDDFKDKNKDDYNYLSQKINNKKSSNVNKTN